jgi:hypothetical protein
MIESTASVDIRQPASFAAGVRLAYADLPEPVQSWIADQFDAPITEIIDRRGGFSPGVAATVRTTTGSGLFVKAVSDAINTDSFRMYRDERDRGLRLPRLPGILKPKGSTEVRCGDQRWIVITFPLLEGSTPVHPWSATDAIACLDTIRQLQRRLTPSPWNEVGEQTAEMIDFLSGWQRLAATEDDPWLADPWVARHLEALVGLERRVMARIPGNTLCHWDLRADNIMMTASGVWLVDWAHARNASAWVDPALLVTDFVASGADRCDGGDIDLDDLLANHPAFDSVPVDHVIGLIGSLGASLHVAAARPAPPNLPTIRDWQRRTAGSLVDWARPRLRL